MQLRLAALVLLVTGAARADGVVELRGAYYKERATRVEQPMVDATFDADPGGTVNAHFLVDSITSASASTGAANGAFTERRYEIGGGYAHDLPGHVKIGADFRYSTESDYFSTWFDVHGEVALFDQNLRLRALLGHSWDDVTNGVAIQLGAPGLPMLEDHLGVNLVSVGATQILGPHLVGAIGYDLGYLDGYQANFYRLVPGANDLAAERVPRQRTRHAISGELRGYLPQTHTTGILAYRFYADDWGIRAHTPEVRIVQEVVRGFELRLRYRYYTQTHADFYQPVYTQAQIADPTVFITEDDKLSAFHTHTVGGQLSVVLSTFGLGSLFGQTRIDFIVERVWQDNSFGDAWVGQLGLTVPFTY